MGKLRIMIVDDEPALVRVIQRVVQLSMDSETVTALSGPEALRIMEQQSFDVIVSDVKMPVMDGVELLRVVKELYPQTLRMVLSAVSGGEIGLQTALSSHQFHLKPGGLSTLAERIRGVMKLRELLPTEGLDQVIPRLKTIPSMPAIYFELQKRVTDKNSSIQDIGKLLEMDVGMSAKIMQLVNSAFFVTRESITRPSQAAVLLGLNVLKSLVLAVHVFSEWKKQSVMGIPLEVMQRHSINVATAAQKIAEAEGVSGQDSDNFYVAGLFHDIGKLVLADNFPASCDSILKLRNEQHISQLAAERQILGATHAEAGAYLLSLWGFPEPTINACAFHHEPRRSPCKGFGAVAAVHVANVIDHEIQDAGQPIAETIDTEFLAGRQMAEHLPRWRQILVPT